MRSGTIIWRLRLRLNFGYGQKTFSSDTKGQKINFPIFWRFNLKIFNFVKVFRNFLFFENLKVKRKKGQNFSLFFKLSVPSAPKMWNFRSLRDSIFVELGSPPPLRVEPPPITLVINNNKEKYFLFEKSEISFILVKLFSRGENLVTKW